MVGFVVSMGQRLKISLKTGTARQGHFNCFAVTQMRDSPLHHALRSNTKVLNGGSRAVEMHRTIHLRGIERPVADTDNTLADATLVQNLVKDLRGGR